MSFDVNNDGTADITTTFTDGKAESDTYTVNGIDYTLTSTSDTYTATSATGSEQKATEVTVSAVGAEESTAKGVNIGATTFNGTATAKFTLPEATAAHTLTFAYSDTAIAKVTDAVGTGSATELKDSGSGTYVIDATSGLTVKIATDAFVDGTLSADEISVTTGWNNGSDVKVTDTAATWSDNIQVNYNDAGNLVKYKFDDTHYYAFLLGTSGAIAPSGEDTLSIEGVTGAFSSEQPVAFSSDGTNYTVVTGSIKNGKITVDSANAAAAAIGSIEAIYTASTKQLKITPGTGTFTATAAEIADATLGTDDDGKLTGASIVATSTGSKDSFGTGEGGLTLTLTTPTYKSGIATSAETYAITFDNITGYTSSGSKVKDTATAAEHWEGSITVNVGGEKVEFKSTDLTAWIALGTSYAVGSTNRSIALATDGSLVYQNGTSATSQWYRATAALGTGNNATTYKVTASEDKNVYTGAILAYDKNAGTITYKSTNQLGTNITADDSQVTWTFGSDATKGAIEVTKAKRVDLDAMNSKPADAGTYTGDGVVGQMDAYTLVEGDKTWKVESQDFTKVNEFLKTVGTIGGKSDQVVEADAANFTSDGNQATLGDALASDTTSISYTLNFANGDDWAKDKWSVSDGSNNIFEVSTATVKIGTTNYTLTDGQGDKLQTALNKVLGHTGKTSAYYNVSVEIGSETGVEDGKKLYASYRSETTTSYTLVFANDKEAASDTNVNNDLLRINVSGFDVLKNFQMSGTTIKEASTGTVKAPLSAFYAYSAGSPYINLASGTGKASDTTFSVSTAAGGTTLAKADLTFTLNDSSTGKASIYTQNGVQILYQMNDGDNDASAGMTLMNIVGAKGVSRGMTFDPSGDNWGDKNAKSKWYTYTSDEAGKTALTGAQTGSANVSSGWSNLISGIMMDTDVKVTDLNDGTTKIYKDVDLGVTNKKYAIAVNGDKVVALASDTTEGTATGYAAMYTNSDVSTFISYDATNKKVSLTQEGYDKLAGGSFGGNYTLDLTPTDTENVLGALGKLQFNFVNGKLRKVNLLDGAGTSINENGYIVSTLSTSQLSTSTDTAAYDSDGSDGFSVSDKKLFIYKGSKTNATLMYTLDLGSSITFGSSDGSSLEDVKTAVSGLKVTVSGEASGSTGANIYTGADAAAKVINGTDNTLKSVTGKVAISDLSDEGLQEALKADGRYTGTLADAAALSSTNKVIKLSVGSADFYLISTGTFGTDGKYTSYTDDKLYNSAGVQISADTYDQGIGITSNGQLQIAGDSNNSVALSLTYTEDDGYKLATDKSSLSKLMETVTFGSDGTITAIANSVFQNAETLGINSRGYDKAVSDANVEPTSKAAAQRRVTAEYVLGTLGYETKEDFEKALTGTLAGISYVENEGGSYSGMIALGSDANNGSLKNTVALVSDSGTAVTSLYASYTFSTSDNKFTVDKLYTDKDGKSENANTYYSIGSDSQTVVVGDLTYKLSANSYSDVTISLTSGSITYDNTTISLTSGAIVNNKSEADTTAVAFRTESSSATTATPAFQFELTGTDISKVSTYTIDGTEVTTTEVSGATFANGVASWSDATTSYTAKWTDVNGNGTVDTSDTVAITSTPLNASNQMTASVTLTASGATTAASYTFTATDTKTVTVTDASGTTVDNIYK